MWNHMVFSSEHLDGQNIASEIFSGNSKPLNIDFFYVSFGHFSSLIYSHPQKWGGSVAVRNEKFNVGFKNPNFGLAPQENSKHRTS